MWTISVIAGLESVAIIKAVSDNRILSFETSVIIFCVFALNHAILHLYTIVVYPELISPLRRIPRGKWWILRRLHHQLIRRATPADALFQIVEETPNDGLIALRDLTAINLLVSKPHTTAEVLVHRAKDFSKPEAIRTLLGYIVGNGLIYLEGDEHRQMKKRSLSYFSFRRIKDLYPLMWDHSLTLASALEANLAEQRNSQDSGGTSCGSIEMNEWAGKTTLDIISTTVYGREFEAHKDAKFDAMVQLLNKFLEPSASMLLYLSSALVFSVRKLKLLPWKMNTVFEDTSMNLKKNCIQLVQDRQQAIAEEDQKEEDRNVDILSKMIFSTDLSVTEIAEQLLTYVIAGNDTTAITLSWALYLLAIDPARQSTLRTEVRQSLGPITVGEDAAKMEIASILEHMPFLNGVLSETLRLYPAVPVTWRTAVQDTSLAGCRVPKGTNIIISPWVINRSPELWGPAADKFQPERWIVHEDEDIQKQNSHSKGGATNNNDFLTFLHGPRNCIGQGFARAELRCLIAVMALRFEWTLDMDERDVVMGGSVTIKPQRGLHLRLKRAG